MTAVSGAVRGWRSRLFVAGTAAFVVVFVVMALTLIVADVWYVCANPQAAREVISKEIWAALKLSVVTSVITVAIALLFAIPMGYALSRYHFRGHIIVDTIVDLPIIFPPLVAGLTLLIFFRTPLGTWIEDSGFQFVYQVKGIILCQLLVSASFAIRTVKSTFDEIDRRQEDVSLTLGCTQGQAFFRVALPMAKNGIVAGGILAWARAFGIFGPLMIFVGAVRMRTEVLPTTIYLEQSIGRLEVAIAVALLMIVIASVALIGIRLLGGRRLW